MLVGCQNGHSLTQLLGELVSINPEKNSLALCVKTLNVCKTREVSHPELLSED